MVWCFLAGAVLLSLLFYSLVKSLHHFGRFGVKQSIPWPLLGDYWRIIFKRASLAEFTQHVYEKHPNTRYSVFHQLTKPTLLIKDPDLIKLITVKDFDYFTDHRWFIDPDAEPLWAKNLLALRGQRWKEMRATLSGSFTGSKMKHMFGLINEAAENFVRYFLDEHAEILEVEMKDNFTRSQKKKCVNSFICFIKECRRFTNDVIATTAFGIKVDSLEEPNNPFYLNGKYVTNMDILAVLKIFAYTLMPPLFKKLKMRIFREESSAFFRKVIRETIKTREKEGIVRPDMINLLLDARKDQINPKVKDLTDDDITSQALIFFLAGFDTVSAALSFGSYELTLNPDIQEKLREEILETHQSNNGNVCYDTLLKMKYMDMVVSEILRKWAPIVAIDRVCTKPYTLEPVTPQEMAVKLRVGDVLSLPYYAIHRDPRFYSNPEKFDPDRFSDENKQNIRPYTYLPFGAGPRNCIGSRLALLEVKILFYNLLMNFKLVPVERTQVPLVLEKGSFRHTAKNGFWIGLKKIGNVHTHN